MGTAWCIHSALFFPSYAYPLIIMRTHPIAALESAPEIIDASPEANPPEMATSLGRTSQGAASDLFVSGAGGAIEGIPETSPTPAGSDQGTSHALTSSWVSKTAHSHALLLTAGSHSGGAFTDPERNTTPKIIPLVVTP